MTSRFGKTYNRKGGEANSKFEEVFSNKKPTLTTKWGETTYKAQLGAKRPMLKEVSELPKRPRLEDSDSEEDPFGFDSDDESKTVTTQSVSQSKVNDGDVTKATAVQGGGTAPVVTSSQGSASSTARFTSMQTSETPTLKLSTDAPGGSRDFQTSSSYDGLPSEEIRNEEQEPPPEQVDNIPPSPFTLRASNCKKYQRPGKPNKMSSEPAENNSSKPAASAQDKPNSVLSASASSTGASTKTAAKPAGRGGGRVRDYTVLHPSCLSVCNVTIQDSIERSIDELVTPAAPADLGEAGQMKKKSDAPPPKPTRFRPTQTKTKKTKTETKLEFFGFEDKEDQEGEEGPESGKAGKSSYKIKYFGFDDLSESDSDDESSRAKEKKAKKAAAALAALSSSVDSPHTSDSQDSQASSNTDAFDFSDDCSPGSTDGQKGRSGKPSDKSKDIGSWTQKDLQWTQKILSNFTGFQSPAKAVYNARHWNQPEPEEIPAPPLSRSQTAPAILSSSSKDSNSHKDDGLFKAPPPPPKVIKSETIPTRLNQDIVTALKCRKEHKELYTVVQHVKHFNDVVEFGENQEFTDDFEYLETGLKSSQPLNTRCLSIISLATRCAMPSFRMHLRARGKVAQVFKMLSDAPQHPNLALCTAALMYILSRDRLNMDLDRACLELMIKLLELDQDYSAHQDQLTAKEVEKVKEKIRKLCETVHNKHLDLENITTGHLAMETLLSLTSKRAGDWFKEELRLLGGLDHIVDKVKECVQNLSQEEDKENLVTVQNPENQGYLIAYKDSQLIVSSARALWHCEDMIQRYSRALNNSSLSLSGAALPHCSFSNVGKAVEDCMRAIIGVLLNLTHDNEWGSTKTGEQEQLIVTALNCVLRVPRYIPQEQRFDVRVLGLGLLINLVEYSSRNRHCLVDMEYIVDDTCLEDSLMQPADPTQSDTAATSAQHTQGDVADKPKSSGALAALVKLFLERERAAILAEAKTDDLISEAPKPALDQSGEWQETSGEIQWVAAEPNDSQTETKESEKKEEEDEELDLNKALQHAGKHMEDSIVASYTALLLGCLCQGSQVNVTTVREHLPKGDFSIMTEMLKKFLSFMNLTCAMGTTGQKSISRVIDYLEHC
ncbi:Wings apart-like protein-like protein Friend of EBNA2 protein WAPL cohesin release factor [Larimichthys crocea]|uniref:Wings apart-like protein-like protein Friend of EBNA2 protein WAPL cohesin release factor n=1 Tax=Larimichthys crocea TaxID=215358 RepID=A0A6G0HNM3_LARCR|nr:Wings apart-like protein-like protein Friend of EBNA2 protein WAPL cohesin release factor [Larimichthys crocea]